MHMKFNARYLYITFVVNIVKVYANSCLSFSSGGPQWYTVEALQGTVTANKRQSVGAFLQHFQRSEAQICEHQAVGYIL